MSDSIMDILLSDPDLPEVDETENPNTTIGDILNEGLGNRLEKAINRKIVEGESPADYWSSRAPIVGSLSTINKLGAAKIAADRYKAGDRSEETIEALAEHFSQAGREADKGFLEKVFDLTTSIPGFAGEFMLTGPAYGVGKSAAKKALGKYTESLVGKTVSGAIGAAVHTMANPQLIASSAARRMTDEYGLGRTEQGDLEAIIDSENDDFLSAVGKGLIDAYIEMGSERAGEAIGIAGAAITRSKGYKKFAGVLDKMPLAGKIKAAKAAVLKRYADSTPEGFRDVVGQLKQQTGWHGVLGEMFEERVGDVARHVTLGDEISLDPEQLLVEGVAFAIPGMASLSMGVAAGKIQSMVIAKMLDTEIDERKEPEPEVGKVEIYEPEVSSGDYSPLQFIADDPEAAQKLADIEGTPSRKQIDDIIGEGASRTIGGAKEREAFRDDVKRHLEDLAEEPPPSPTLGEQVVDEIYEGVLDEDVTVEGDFDVKDESVSEETPFEQKPIDESLSPHRISKEREQEAIRREEERQKAKADKPKVNLEDLDSVDDDALAEAIAAKLNAKKKEEEAETPLSEWAWMVREKTPPPNVGEGVGPEVIEAPQPKPKQPRKSPKRKPTHREKADEAKKELDSALDEIGNLGLFSQPIQPHAIKPFIKVTKALIKLGYHEFADMIRVMSEKFGPERVANGSEILESIWSLVRDNYDAEGKLGEVGDTKSILKELGHADTGNESDAGVGDSPEASGGNKPEATDKPDTTGASQGDSGPKDGKGGKSDTGSEGQGERRPDETGDGEGADSPGDTDAGESGTRPPESSGTDASTGNDNSKVQGKKSVDYRIPDDVLEVAPRGAITQIKANIAAIKVLKKLQDGDRQATASEQEKLAQYTGWGNLAPVFDEAKARDVERNQKYGFRSNDSWEKQYYKHYQAVKELLTQKEWFAAAESTLYAHYTSIPVMRGMWKMAEKLGFKDGNVLEPASGVGHFISTAPPVNAMMVEIDPMSGAIAKYLHPSAEVFDGQGFENVNVPENSIDLAITNVPFAQQGPADAKSRYGITLNLHNYFIARMIDAVKPGGIVMTITSPGTMDNQLEQRKFLASKADLVASFRLPNDAFKSNAGTEVSADILIFRKPDGSIFRGESWVGHLPGKTYDNKDVSVNEYFIKHPEHVLGRMSLEGTMYGANEYATLPDPGVSIEAQLEKALSLLPSEITTESQGDVNFGELKELSGLTEGQIVKQGDYFSAVKDGKRVPLNQMHKNLAKNKSNKAFVKSYMALKSHLKAHLNMMVDPESTEGQVQSSLDKLNGLYDSHVAAEWLPNSSKTKGQNYINSAMTRRLRFDPDFYLMSAMEDSKNDVDEETLKSTTTWVKGQVLLRRTRHPNQPPTSAETVVDAVRVSLGYRGRIDLPWVSELTGKDIESIESEMAASGIAFKNPQTGLWEQKELYLTGNVRTKLKQAEIAAKSDAKFERNAEALKAIQPELRTVADINFKLGGAWIPQEVVRQFVADELDSRNAVVSYNEAIDQWRVDNLDGNYQTYNTYAVVVGDMVRMTADKLLTRILNLKSLTIKKNIGTSKKPQYVLDEAATAEAKVTADNLQTAFTSWVKNSPEAKKELEGAYNEAFNFIVPAEYNGEHLVMPGSTIDLRPFQKNQLWRWLVDGHGMAAMAVGAGKTFVYIGAAMEMKRMGLAQKPVVVVQNATLEQFAASARQMYPGGNFLVASKEDLTANNRQRFMGRIQSGDYDAIIMAQSSFNLLPNDPTRMEAWYDEQIHELHEAMLEIQKEEGEKGPTVKDIMRRIKKFKKDLDAYKAKLKERQLDPINFEDLGVDALFIDEAHEFKKLPIVSKIGQLRGLNLEGSQRGVSLLLKTKFIQENNRGRGVFLGTGTPITNTMGEAYNMLRLSSPHLLEEFGVKSFDRWVSAFGKIEDTYVQNAAGRLVSKEVLNSFENGVELMRLIFSSWNVVTLDDLREYFDENDGSYPKLKGGKTTAESVPITPPVKQFMQFVTKTYSRWEKLIGKEKRLYSWVPVVLFGASKSASLDIRMVYSNAADHPGSKVNLMVNRAMELYEESDEHRGAQLIFSDAIRQMDMEKILAFANGEGVAMEIDASEKSDLDEDIDEDRFIYDDIKKKLIDRGVPESEIAIIGDYEGRQREILFDSVNEGKVRFMIGSTAKMGVGVNVQERLYALHHLDTPFMPMQLEQRQGRILRQGNGFAKIGNGEVHEISWAMSGTTDGAIFETVLRKSKFIRQILGGRIDPKQFDFPSDPNLDAIQDILMGISDPRNYRRIELQRDIKTMKIQKRTFEENQDRNVRKKAEAEDRIQRFEERLIPQVEEQKKIVDDAIVDKEFELTVQGKTTKGREEIIKVVDEWWSKWREHVKNLRETKAIGDNEFFRTEQARLTVNGITVDPTFYTTSSNDSKGNVEHEVRNGKTTFSINGEELSDSVISNATGLLSAIRQLPKKAEELSERYHAKLEQAKKDLQRIDAIDPSEGFPNEQELADAEIELAELEEAIQAEDREAADKDAGIEKVPPPNVGEGDEKALSLPKHPLRVDGRKDAKEGVKPISREAIIKRVSRIFSLPMGSGWFKKRASGIYKTHPEAIRFKESMYGDLAVASHEVGHHIWKKAKLEEKLPGDIKKELKKLDYDPLRMDEDEGFAEFLRFFLTRDDYTKDAPLFNEWWKDFLALNEDWADKVGQFRSLVDRWRDQGAINRVREHIRQEPSTPADETFKEHWGGIQYDMMTDTYIKSKDSLHAFKLLQKAGEKRGYKLKAGEGIYERAMAFKSAGPQLAAQAIRNGPMTMGENPEVIGPSMAEVLSEIKPSQYDDFSRWVIVNHQVEDQLGPRDTGISNEDAAAFQKKFDSPAFRRSHDKLIEFNDALIKMLVSVRAITDEDAKRILDKYEKYSPLLRVSDTNRNNLPAKYVDFGPVVRRRKGSGREILDPIAATMVRANRFYSAASRQIVQNELVKMYSETEGMGDWLEAVQPQTNAIHFNLEEIKDELKDVFGDIEDFDVDALATIFRPDYGQRKGQPIIGTTIDGQRRLYEIKDRHLFEALNAMEPYLLPGIIENTIGKATRLTKLGAVGVNASFGTKNPVADLITFVFQSKMNAKSLPQGTLKAVGYTFKGLHDKMRALVGSKDRDVFLQFAKDWGIELSHIMGGEIDAIRHTIDDVMANSTKARLFNVAKHPVEAMVGLIGISEMGPRTAELEYVLKQHGITRKMLESGNLPSMSAIVDAVNAANDVTVNFKRQGTWGRVMNRLSAFWNASAESLDKMIRSGIDNPARFATLMTMTTIATTVYWLYRKDDDEYQEEESWLKYGFFNYTDDSGEHKFRIPRGHGYGWIFSASVEAVLNQMFKDDPKAVEEWVRESIKNMLPNPFDMILEPGDIFRSGFGISGVKELSEVASDTDTFRNRPIEGRMKELPPFQRFNARTTPVAKTIGQAVNVSPLQIDHVLNGVTGGFSGRLQRYEGGPIGIAGFTLYGEATKSISEFYKRMDELEMKARGEKAKDGKVSKATHDEIYRLDKAQELIRMIRPYYSKGGKDKYREGQRYAVSVARAALGKEKLDRYESFLSATDLPAELTKARNQWMNKAKRARKDNRKVYFSLIKDLK